MVEPFFFYSGYGIMEQMKERGEKYTKGFLKRRLLPIWASFAVYVSLYLVYSICVHSDYSVKRILLAFIGWESLGNSNWFMFDTFILYLFLSISFRFCKGNHKFIVCSMSILCCVFVAVLCCFKESWWWNTVLCFPAGMVFSLLRNQIEKVVDKNYFLSLLILVIGFLLLHELTRRVRYVYCLYAIGFSLIVVILSMKVKIKGTALNLLGKHVFGIYMIQRLIYMILLNINSINTNQYGIFCLSFALSVGVGILVDSFNSVLIKILRIRR